uniref:Uncharacterized protein n=1 Tax=Tetradesmus obliquus TaxID=3088 RepID=A0A383W7P2_TETOB|eukprot:jgi/Sobl393_1/3743/SZX73263.1
MPTSGTGALLGHGGRWERWQPPAATAAAAAAASKDQQPSTSSSSSSSSSQQWRLLSSGQSLYAFQPGQDPSRGITVHVMEAADAAPLLMTDCTTDCTTAAGDQGSESSSSSGADVMRSTNQFNVEDVWFLPHLPEPGADSGLALLRLWAGNEHGFAMAPVRLPQQLLAAAGAAAADADAAAAAAAPWIANLYVKHPSLEPGVGRRWGWNVQYAPAQPPATTTPATHPTAQSSSSSSSGWGLQHIHHTSLGMLLVDDVQKDMQPGGPQTLPPANNIQPPASGIDAFMAQQQRQHQGLTGTALHFAYDSSSGQLTRRDNSSCSWTPSSTVAVSNSHGDANLAAASSSRESWPVLEHWYSSGGYTKVPASLQETLAAGQPVVIEAGAIIPSANKHVNGQASDGGGSGAAEFKSGSSRSGSGSVGKPAAVTRWLLSYSAADGLLQSARLERYQL